VLAVSRARLLTGRDDYYAELSELREMLAKSEAELAELRRQVRLMNERNADLAEAVESGFGALRQLVEERVARREETRSRLGSRPRAPE
jgi:CHASE3 domain sensor protein